MDAVPQRLKAVNIEYCLNPWLMQHMQSTNLDAVIPMKTDRFLTLRRAKSVVNHKHGRISSARPFEVEEEDDDDEIPLDISCKTGLQLW